MNSQMDTACHGSSSQFVRKERAATKPRLWLVPDKRKKKLLEQQASPAERLYDRIGLLFGVTSTQRSCFIAQLKVAGLRPVPSHALFYLVRVLDIFCAGV